MVTSAVRLVVMSVWSQGRPVTSNNTNSTNTNNNTTCHHHHEERWCDWPLGDCVTSWVAQKMMTPRLKGEWWRRLSRMRARLTACLSVVGRMGSWRHSQTLMIRSGIHDVTVKAGRRVAHRNNDIILETTNYWWGRMWRHGESLHVTGLGGMT